MSFQTFLKAIAVPKNNQKTPSSSPSLWVSPLFPTQRKAFRFKRLSPLVSFSFHLPKLPFFKKRGYSIFSHHSRGFVMIFLFSWLPLFLGLFFSFQLIFIFIKTHHQTHFLCQKKLLKTQKKVLIQLKALFQLNPKATSLQRKHDQAKRKLQGALASQNPLLIAEAKSQLIQVQASQSLLHQKQRQHIQKGNLLMLHAGEELKQIFKDHRVPSLLEFSFSQKKMALKAKTPLSLAPIYTPHPSLMAKQALQAKWSIDTKDFLHLSLRKWFKKIFPHPFLLRGKCRASLLQKGNKWTSLLVSTSSLLNLLNPHPLLTKG